MDKQHLIDLKNQAEQNCRLLFEQLKSYEAKVAELNIELERSRGDYRTYDKLLNEWQEPPKQQLSSSSK